MKVFFVRLVAITTLVFSLSGCGNDEAGGSGQGGGVSDTGLLVKIDTLTPEDTVNVDIHFISDCILTDALVTPETFTDHDATVTVTVTPSPGFNANVIGKFITLTSYYIKYSLSHGYTYAVTPPVIPDKEYKIALTIASEESGTTDLRLIDLDTKIKIYDEYIVNGWAFAELPSYTATYKFSGTDDRNRAIEIIGSLTFTIGAYNNC